MTDVARLAGVSHQTVSRVLNDHPNVREQTRLRVRAAIAELGYRPNRAARALVTGRSQLIGVGAQNRPLCGPASLLAPFEQAAAEAGFAVSVGSVSRLDRESISGAVERHLDQRVAGLVVIAPVASAGAALDDMPAHALITGDQVAGARAPPQHLLDAGHRTVWHIAGPAEWYDAAGRIEGWRQTLVAAGAEVPPLLPAGAPPPRGDAAGE